VIRKLLHIDGSLDASSTWPTLGLTSLSQSIISANISNPTNEYHQAAMCILHYIKNVPSASIFLHRNYIIQLKAYNDFNWEICPESQKSITGFSVYLGESLISWKSKKQQKSLKVPLRQSIVP